MCFMIIVEDIFITINTVEFVNIFVSTINLISCMKTIGIHVIWNWNLRVFDFKLVVKNSCSNSPYFYFKRLVSKLLSLNNSIIHFYLTATHLNSSTGPTAIGCIFLCFMYACVERTQMKKGNISNNHASNLHDQINACVWNFDWGAC